MRLLKGITRREKVLIAIIFTLIVLWQVDGRLTSAASPPHESIYTDSALYRSANAAAGRGEFAKAAAFLYAYIQRNPREYKLNINDHADDVDEVFDNWVDDIQTKMRYADIVNGEIDRCSQYPCPGVRGSFREVFPEDMVEVCQHSDYRGICSYLSVGEYDRHVELGVPNDSISSVRVGSKVKVLLCVHSLNHTSECVEFNNSDSNLTNNRVPGHDYFLNDNVSTARVTYKDGIGFTLP